MKRLLMVFCICAMAANAAFSQDDTYYTGDESTVTVKATQAPPALPDYVQPVSPGDGYYWTPGYWAWNGNDYYWVAGVWVMPPSAGLLWTPGYWGFYNGYYGWHSGYWGAHVGYYGGVHYGYGYNGSGFYGGRWDGGHFMYNTAVWHVNRNVHNTYVDRTVIEHNNVVSHASFNGPNGVHYRPSGGEQGGMHENHVAVSKEQAGHEQGMAGEHGQYHTGNAHPATHSMSSPGGQRFDQRGHSVGGGGHAGGGGHTGGGNHGGGHGGGGRR